MKCVYVLMMHTHKCATGPDNKEFITSEPYAVFEDSITAERMKRDGDEIVKVPFFEDPTERALQAIERCKGENPQLVKPWTVTWTNTDRWGKDSSTLAPPPGYNTYPRVTCNKTVDEHSWTNRSD